MGRQQVRGNDRFVKHTFKEAHVMAKGIGGTIVGVFEERQKAQRAVNELKAAGFTDDQIGVVSHNRDGSTTATKGDGDTAMGEAAAAGLATGAGVGALWGLGILAGVLPGIGPAIAGGTLGVLLSSAAAGAAALGVAGALIGLGIPDDDAGYYENEFKAGRTLVTVKAGAKAPAAQTVIKRNGGYGRPARTMASV
jgi:hypothetical protein